MTAKPIAPANWVRTMFDLAEGPLFGYQAAIRGMARDGDAYRVAVVRERMSRAGLMVRR